MVRALLRVHAPGKSRGAAFIDIGDQFVALERSPPHEPDRGRHFGLVVDDKEAARAALREAASPSRRRPRSTSATRGNNIQVVDYREIQFLKAPEVLRTLGAEGLEKAERALEELRAKGIQLRL